ncbi:hypothetical protein OKA04_22720 [Luteolibacter flavescens]|uniref:Uncharacterized protein n=1 Tax=Luteolibacter flavescens TaxID=1859460 RepID=A0ABT3FVE5_9BACT|nr:hypothetical protein [Luteolibacter flavescens]MCW1887568.1 hypothetical protein [Luteolibacter flavescens]
MMLRTLRLLFIFSPLLASAQDKPTPHSLRILTLGDPPPYRQEVRNGVRYEIPAADGTIPPRNLEVPALSESGEPENLKLRLRLGIASDPLQFPLPENRSVETRQPSGPWAKIPLSTSEATLALIWRTGPDWNKVGVIHVPDGKADRSKGDCRFINVTAKPMGIVIGTEKLKLEPRTSIMRSLPAGTQETTVSILYPGADGTLQSCLSTTVTRSADKLQQYVIYAADGNKPRVPVKVLPLTETR